MSAAPAPPALPAPGPPPPPRSAAAADDGDAPTAADAAIAAAAAAGVDVCFANPGTTEMWLVAALDRAAPRVRACLGLHEAVCTGAADGFAVGALRAGHARRDARASALLAAPCSLTH